MQLIESENCKNQETEAKKQKQLLRAVNCCLMSKNHFQKWLEVIRIRPETAVRRCSSMQVFLKISQYSQKNTSVGVSFVGEFRTGDFPANIAKFLRTAFFVKSLRWMLLYERKLNKLSKNWITIAKLVFVNDIYFPCWVMPAIQTVLFFDIFFLFFNQNITQPFCSVSHYHNSLTFCASVSTQLLCWRPVTVVCLFCYS